MATATVREAGLDKFYTRPQIAKKYLTILGTQYEWSSWDCVIEPSAGNGSFFTQIPTDKKIGIDIFPEHTDLIKEDFLTYTPSINGRILVVGNPPFGKVSSLAIKFFNHAAEWATVIAFIIPRTFRRISIQNKLHLHFHLVYDEEIPQEPCAFSPPMMAKCCFQIWEKKSSPRSLIDLPTTHSHWTFLGLGPLDAEGQPTPPNGADFAIRAYGGACGELVESNLASLRPKSWHWIQSILETKILLERFRSLDYSVSLDTARQNSLGRGELVRLYTDAFTEEAP